MAEKKKKKPASKKPVKKAVKRETPQKAAKKVIAAEPKPVTFLECQVCGYRLIVDRKCGCTEEHILVCCGQPMQKIETTI